MVDNAFSSATTSSTSTVLILYVPHMQGLLHLGGPEVLRDDGVGVRYCAGYLQGLFHGHLRYVREAQGGNLEIKVTAKASV